jgi:hypothetical protein
MRVLAGFLITLSIGWAQSPQEQAEAVLKQMERAEQTGNFDAYLNLWTRDKSSGLENLRPYVIAQPEIRYRLTKSFVRGDDAVLLAQRGSTPFVMTLRREGGQWKIQDQVWRDTAPDPNSVYAWVPPEPGAFARAGSPWDQVAAAMPPGEAARQGWQIKAVFDESYLYIRIESSAELPPPGSTIATPPGGWPVLKIDTSDAGEFVLYDQVNVGDQATFDTSGKANSHRAFAAYMIRLERNHREVFSASAGLEASPLVQVTERDYDIRIPLATMGILDSRATRMTIGDAQWPKSAVLSIVVQRYAR